MSTWYIGSPFFACLVIGNSILRANGDSLKPSSIIIVTSFINAILDPIFIFELDSFGGIGFGLGIAGAAMATVISQLVVFFVFIVMLFFKDHSYISFNLNDFTFSTEILWDIIKVGLPASLSMIVMAVGQGVFNKILAHISVETVAAYQVAGRLDMLVFLPIFSIAASLTTLIGMFYGAKEFEALRYTIRYGIISALIITIFSSALVYIFADQVVRFFTEDESIVLIAVNFLQIFRVILLIYYL